MSNIFFRKLKLKIQTTIFTISFLSGIFYAIDPATAYAVYCSNCSTFYQQMYQYAEEVNTALNTAQQSQIQTQQYNDMLMQGLPFEESLYNNITPDLQQVVNIYNQSQSLGRNIANLDSEFRRQYPGYDAYLNSSGNAAQVMPGRYTNWSKQGFDNARTAMQSAGLNTSSFASESSQLDQIMSRSQSAAGRMQAIQAGNEIAASNVQQLQKLRDLLATQIIMQGNYMAQQQERASMDDAMRAQRRKGVLIIDEAADKGF